MVIFAKKNKDEESEEVSEQKEKKTKKRKISGKGPPRSWGRKERFIVFFFFATTVIASSILALSARSWKLPGIPRIKISVPTFSLLSEEEIVLEGEGRLREREKADGVIISFKEKTKNLSGVYGLYVLDLQMGFSYGVNELETFEPASLNKLPVMAAMYLEGEGGNLDLATKYTLKDSDKLSGGSLYAKPVGYEITYRNLIRLMGKESDNTAFNIARGLLGEEKIREVITKIGMESTSLPENETTPEDIGVFFEELWNGNVVSDEHKDELLDFLTDTIYEDWIVKGVPEGVRVAHKYGREIHIVNDAGIVLSEKPFVLVIMSKGVVEKEAGTVIPELTRIVFEAEFR